MPVIVLEGSNGTGTSTQCNRLKSFLESMGKVAIVTRHPGSTDLGQQLRKILKFGDVNTTPQQEILLFAADAIAFYQNYVGHMQDEFIICDRLNITGALTYQKAGGASYDQVMAMFQVLKSMGWNKIFEHLFVFVAPYSVLQSRLDKPNLIDQDKEHGDKKDRFESRGNTFMEEVCANYAFLSEEEILKDFFQVVSVIDASLSVDEVFSQILEELNRHGTA